MEIEAVLSPAAIKALNFTSSRATLFSGALSLTCPSNWAYDLIETPLLHQTGFDLSFKSSDDALKHQELRMVIESFSIYLSPHSLASLLPILSSLTASSSSLNHPSSAISVPSVRIPSIKDSQLHFSIKNAAALISSCNSNGRRVVAKRPLFEASIDELNLQLSVKSQTEIVRSLVAASLSLTLSIEAFNFQKMGWEPVMDPWQNKLDYTGQGILRQQLPPQPSSELLVISRHEVKIESGPIEVTTSPSLFLALGASADILESATLPLLVNQRENGGELAGWRVVSLKNELGLPVEAHLIKQCGEGSARITAESKLLDSTRIVEDGEAAQVALLDSARPSGSDSHAAKTLKGRHVIDPDGLEADWHGPASNDAQTAVDLLLPSARDYELLVRTPRSLHTSSPHTLGPLRLTMVPEEGHQGSQQLIGSFPIPGSSSSLSLSRTSSATSSPVKKSQANSLEAHLKLNHLPFSIICSFISPYEQQVNMSQRDGIEINLRTNVRLINNTDLAIQLGTIMMSRTHQVGDESSFAPTLAIIPISRAPIAPGQSFTLPLSTLQGSHQLVIGQLRRRRRRRRNRFATNDATQINQVLVMWSQPVDVSALALSYTARSGEGEGQGGGGYLGGLVDLMMHGSPSQSDSSSFIQMAMTSKQGEWTIDLSPPIILRNILPVPTVFLLRFFSFRSLDINHPPSKATTTQISIELAASSELPFYSCPSSSLLGVKIAPLGYQLSQESRPIRQMAISDNSSILGRVEMEERLLLRPMSSATASITLHLLISAASIDSHPSMSTRSSSELRPSIEKRGETMTMRRTSRQIRLSHVEINLSCPLFAVNATGLPLALTSSSHYSASQHMLGSLPLPSPSLWISPSAIFCDKGLVVCPPNPMTLLPSSSHAASVFPPLALPSTESAAIASSSSSPRAARGLSSLLQESHLAHSAAVQAQSASLLTISHEQRSTSPLTPSICGDLIGPATEHAHDLTLQFSASPSVSSPVNMALSGHASDGSFSSTSTLWSESVTLHLKPSNRAKDGDEDEVLLTTGGVSCASSVVAIPCGHLSSSSQASYNQPSFLVSVSLVPLNVTLSSALPSSSQAFPARKERRSFAILIAPRIIVDNSSGHPLQLQQIDHGLIRTPRGLHLDEEWSPLMSGQFSAMQLSLLRSPLPSLAQPSAQQLLLNVKVSEPGWSWSNVLSLGSYCNNRDLNQGPEMGEVAVKIRRRNSPEFVQLSSQVSDGGSLIPAISSTWLKPPLRQCQKQTPTTYLFSLVKAEDSMSMLAAYRIENFTLDRIFLRQVDSNGEQEEEEEDLVRPYSSFRFDWNDTGPSHSAKPPTVLERLISLWPLKTKKAGPSGHVIALSLSSGRRLAEINLKGPISSLSMASRVVPLSGRSAPRQVVSERLKNQFFSLEADGPTRVLKIIDLDRHPSLTYLPPCPPHVPTTLIQRGAVKTGQSRLTEETMLDLSCSLESIGISLVSSMVEMAYVSFTNLELGTKVSAAHASVNATIHTFRVDNCLPSSIHPFLSFSPAAKTVFGGVSSPTLPSSLTATNAKRKSLSLSLSMMTHPIHEVTCLESLKVVTAPFALNIEEDLIRNLLELSSDYTLALSSSARSISSAPPSSSSSSSSSLSRSRPIKIYIENLSISPIVSYVSFTPLTPWQLNLRSSTGVVHDSLARLLLPHARLEGTWIKLSPFHLHHPILTPRSLSDALVKHYAASALRVLPRLLVTLDLLADFPRLIHSLGLGLFRVILSPLLPALEDLNVLDPSRKKDLHIRSLPSYLSRSISNMAQSAIDTTQRTLHAFLGSVAKSSRLGHSTILLLLRHLPSVSASISLRQPSERLALTSDDQRRETELQVGMKAPIKALLDGYRSLLTDLLSSSNKLASPHSMAITAMKLPFTLSLAALQALSLPVLVILDLSESTALSLRSSLSPHFGSFHYKTGLRIPRYISHARPLSRYDLLEAKCRSFTLSLGFRFDDDEEIGSCHEVNLYGFDLADAPCYLVLTRTRAIFIRGSTESADEPSVLLVIPLSNILLVNSDAGIQTLCVSYMPSSYRGGDGVKDERGWEGSGGACLLLRLVKICCQTTDEMRKIKQTLESGDNKNKRMNI